MAVSVYIADDHPLFLAALESLVRARGGLELVGKAHDGRDALEAIRELRPDVALLDVHMPALDGLQVLNAVVRDELATRVVLVSGAASGDLVYQAVVAGAAGFLSKNAPGDEICDAILAVARGGTVLPVDLQGGLVDQIRRRHASDRAALSKRELEILRLTAAGNSAQEIAGQLFLSVATVRTHLQHVYEKLAVSDRAAAVAEAMRQGLIE